METIPFNKKELPIIETENFVSYLGVKLEKAKNNLKAPSKEQYNDYINDKFSLELQKKIAVAWLQGDAIMVEGGTSIGKTTTIKKMAADLGYEVHYVNLNGASDVEDLMGRYIPNPNRKSPEDPEYIFADGKVTSGLRMEEGKIKVIIVDEYNSASPNILIRLHEVLDALERNGEVTLSEDASEVVPVNKGMTKIVSLTNPPGKGYLQREPLDPAQLRRWVYQKEQTSLPKDSFAFATQSLFGLHKEPLQNFGNKILESRETVMSQEELGQIPGMEVIVKKYEEFHEAAKQLVTARKIGNDQPQKFIFDDREEPRRVRDFIMHFYRGDLTETFQEALRYYYIGKILDPKDKKQLEELVKHVMYKAPENTQRIQVPDTQTATATPDNTSRFEKISMVEAKEIMGEDSFYGPEEIQNAFNFSPDVVPKVPFNREELERAKSLGQELILYVDRDGEGNPLTGEKIKEIYNNNETSKGDTFVASDWFESDSIASKEIPRMGWRLSAKDAFKESGNKNYIQQTEAIVAHLGSEIFPEGLPSIYWEAVEEFESVKESLRAPSESSDDSEWKPAAEKLANLKINQLCRENFAEVLYRIALHEKKTGERLLDSPRGDIYYTWTCSRDSVGRLVSVGDFDSVGAIVNGWKPRLSASCMGVCFSRSE